MPCNTIQRSKIEFLAKSTDIGLLRKCLEAMGLKDIAQVGELLIFRTLDGVGNYNKATGKLILPQSFDVNAIKRAYSEQVVQSQAIKHGWRISWRTNEQGHRQAMVQRRG